MKPAANETTPKAMSNLVLSNTKFCALPWAANQPSKPPRQPRMLPPMPPIRPPAQSGHQAPAEPLSTEPKLPLYSTSFRGLKKTVPCAGRYRLISKRVGPWLVPVRSKGNLKRRQFDVPEILPISPDSPNVRLK